MDTPNPTNTPLYQIIPSEVCFSCDVCCRFLEADSPLAPIFTEIETEKAIAHGADPVLFRPQADGKSAQIQLNRITTSTSVRFLIQRRATVPSIRSVRLTVNSIPSL